MLYHSAADKKTRVMKTAEKYLLAMLIPSFGAVAVYGLENSWRQHRWDGRMNEMDASIPVRETCLVNEAKVCPFHVIKPLGRLYLDVDDTTLEPQIRRRRNVTELWVAKKFECSVYMNQSLLSVFQIANGRSLASFYCQLIYHRHHTYHGRIYESINSPSINLNKQGRH